MALTDAQKRANAADIARRKALGDVKVTVWLSAAAKVRLDELTAKHGTRQKAIDAALMGLATHLPPKPVKPASEPEKRPSVALKSRPAFNPQPKTGKKR